MPDNPENFGENPFKNLDLSRFRPVLPALDPVAQAERSLFLRAVERLQAPAASKGGFLLAEQCKLPVIAMKKQPKSGPKPESKSEPKPEPVTKSCEADEFLLAVRNATPIKAGGRRIAKKPEPRPRQDDVEETLADFMAGRLEFAITGTGEYLEGYVTGMDELVLNRLREGQLSPEAHLDLHGLNASQAFETLSEFIHNAWLKDLRTVLIVTGRGKNSPSGQGVLRQKLQAWLTKEPFKRVIMAFCTAKPHDGGPGSIYVLLRRFRKKGRIQWDRMFIDGDM